MEQLLEMAGKAFLKVFGSALFVLSQGIWTAPDLHGAELIAVSAFLGALAAGISALQAFVPQLTVAAHIAQPWGAWCDSFLRAFVATLVTLLPGALTAPNLGTGKALAAAAVLGAVNAGVHALQGLLTPNQSPSPGFGLKFKVTA